MKVVNDEHLDLEYNDDLKCIIQSWKGYFNSDFFRNGVEKTNQLFEKQAPVEIFLVDISTSGVIKNEDTEWAAETAIPRAIKNGLKYYGFVVPENVFAQLSLNNFRKQLNQPSLETKLFDNLNSAKKWAEEINERVMG